MTTKNLKSVFYTLSIALIIMVLTALSTINVSANSVDVSSVEEFTNALNNPSITMMKLISNIEVTGTITVDRDIRITTDNSSNLTIDGNIVVTDTGNLSIDLENFIFSSITQSQLTVNGILNNNGKITAETPLEVTGTGTFTNNGTMTMSDDISIDMLITNSAGGKINIEGDATKTRNITTPISNSGVVTVATSGAIGTGSNSSFVINTTTGITIDSNKSTTVSTIGQLKTALSQSDELTNITISAPGFEITEEITIPTGKVVTIADGASVTITATGKLINNGSIIGDITNNGVFENNNILTGIVIGTEPIGDGIIIYNNSTTIISFAQFRLALNTDAVKNIFINNQLDFASSETLTINKDVTVMIPTRNPTDPADDNFLALENGAVIVNYGTIIVQTPNGLRPLPTGTKDIYNLGRIITSVAGTINSGNVYTGNTENPSFDIADNSITLSEFNSLKFFVLGDDDFIKTDYTGTVTIFGESTDGTKDIEILNGSHNVNLSNLTINGITTPFIINPTSIANLNLIGNNILTARDNDQAGIMAHDATLNLTSATAGKLLAAGEDGDSSSGIRAANLLINGNADVTASGAGDGSGIQSNSFTIGGLARVTATHLPTAGIDALAFSVKPSLLIDTGNIVTVRAGETNPGLVISNYGTTDYHENEYVQVQISPPVSIPPAILSPDTGVYR